MSPKVQSPKSKGLGPRSVVKSQLGYALDASARNGARLWSKTQPQRLADAKDVGTTPRAAAGAPHTAALRSANLRQVHSTNPQFSMDNAQSSGGSGSMAWKSCSGRGAKQAQMPRSALTLSMAATGQDESAESAAKNHASSTARGVNGKLGLCRSRNWNNCARCWARLAPVWWPILAVWIRCSWRGWGGRC